MRWWWAVAPAADLAGVARRLEQAADLPGASLIKSGPRRSVWSLPGVAGGLLVKRFEVRGGERWKYALLASRARSEYRAMEAFVRLGLPVVRPLGFGERRRSAFLREAWFVGRLVPDARTLADELDRLAAARDDRAAFELARAAVVLVGQLHRHPWLHRDLHAGNLLLDRGGRLLVTDLHSVWRVPRLTRRQRVANLARLLYSLRAAVDLGCAPVLVREYAERRGEPAEDLVRAVQLGLRDFERGYRRGRVARCLADSSLFAAERLPEGRVFRRRAYAAGQLRADLREHQRNLESEPARVLGRARRSRVTLVGEGPDQRVVKDYGPAGALPALRQASGRGRARSAWVGARRLEVAGLGTPQALALLERTDGRAVLVTRALRGARQLRGLAPELHASAACSGRAAVARGLGHLVGRLARAGLRHDDLSPKNVFVLGEPAPPPRDARDRPPTGAAHLQLIDLDGLRPMPPHDARGLARMLEQLADLPVKPSRTDVRRFVLAYAAAAGRDLPRDVAQRALVGAAARAAERAQAATRSPLDPPAGRS